MRAAALCAAGGGLLWLLGGRARAGELLLGLGLGALALGLRLGAPAPGPGPHASVFSLLEAPRGDGRGCRAAVWVHGAHPGRARLELPPSECGLIPGERAVARIELGALRGQRNPGGGDARRRAARRGIHARARIAGPVLVRLEPAPRGPGAWLERARRALAGSLDPAARSTRAGALLRALVLGDTSRLDAGVRDAFARSGTAHLLSVSGLHVAWVLAVTQFGVGALLRCAPWLGWLRRARIAGADRGSRDRDRLRGAHRRRGPRAALGGDGARGRRRDRCRAAPRELERPGRSRARRARERSRGAVRRRRSGSRSARSPVCSPGAFRRGASRRCSTRPRPRAWRLRPCWRVWVCHCRWGACSPTPCSCRGWACAGATGPDGRDLGSARGRPRRSGVARAARIGRAVDPRGREPRIPGPARSRATSAGAGARSLGPGLRGAHVRSRRTVRAGLRPAPGPRPCSSGQSSRWVPSIARMRHARSSSTSATAMRSCCRLASAPG